MAEGAKNWTIEVDLKEIVGRLSPGEFDQKAKEIAQRRGAELPFVKFVGKSIEQGNKELQALETMLRQSQEDPNAGKVIFDWLWWLAVKRGDSQMVTIKRIAEESGVNENTVKGRIRRARKMGILKRWEKQGGTVLVDREEGLEIARGVGKHLAKMEREKKSS